MDYLEETGIRVISMRELDSYFEINEIEDIELIAQSVAGARRFIIRSFNPRRTLDPTFMEIQPFSFKELKPFCKHCFNLKISNYKIICIRLRAK